MRIAFLVMPLTLVACGGATKFTEDQCRFLWTIGVNKAGLCVEFRPKGRTANARNTIRLGGDGGNRGGGRNSGVSGMGNSGHVGGSAGNSPGGGGGAGGPPSGGGGNPPGTGGPPGGGGENPDTGGGKPSRPGYGHGDRNHDHTGPPGFDRGGGKGRGKPR